MVATFALMDVSEQLKPSVFFYTSLKDAGCTFPTSSLLIIVYAQDRRLICLDSASDSGRIPSTRKSLIGCAHAGALTTTISAACWGAAASWISASWTSTSWTSAISISVSELPTAAPGPHSAAPGDGCSSGVG